MNADKLASFRIDSDLWQQFQSHAKENNVTATALLISYIKSVVNTGNVNTSNPIINTSAEVNAPTLSIQDIDKCIDDKIKSSMQIPSIQNIEDLIDARIASACQSGAVKDAISNSYAAVMGNFNGLLSEVEALKKQLQELQQIPPAAAAAAADDQLPIPNNTIENIRTTLKRKNKSVSAEQIRKAFSEAGWDGDNYQEIRKAVIDSLSGGEQS